MRRFLLTLLVLMFLWLQYRLWWGDSSVNESEKLSEDIAQLEDKLKQQQKLNRALRKDIDNLKYNTEALEELARERLGLIKKNEHFFRVIPNNQDNR